MTFQYVSVDEAIRRSGVRMVVVGGVRTSPKDGVRSAYDAVDGAHSAASKCPRVVASKRTT